MAKVIAMFNHKGGVSKTTTTFGLGWMLAEKGNRVVMIDTDPQCNLTGLVLGDALDNYYRSNPNANIYAALAPAFLSQPREISAVNCVQVQGRNDLLLLPGHVNLSEYEVTLGIAQELAGSIQALKNLPGAFHFLISKIAQAQRADYILVDMSPNLGSLNQNFLMSSNGFIVPTAPDYFSVMAVDSLTSILPRWIQWARRAYASEPLRGAAYPFPAPNLKFFGTIVQKFRLRLGGATVGFQDWIDAINLSVRTKLFPELRQNGMTFGDDLYQQVGASPADSYCLSQIPDFNTLVATSQSHRTPVFALTDEMFGHAGVILDQDRRKRDELKTLFDTLAERVITLANHA